MDKQIELDQDLIKLLSTIRQISPPVEVSDRIMKFLKEADIEVFEHNFIHCEKNNKLWRFVSYKEDAPHVFLIEKQGEKITIRPGTKSGLSDSILDYMVFPLSHDRLETVLKMERYEGVFINGWDRKKLRDPARESRWDFFFRPVATLLGEPHERRHKTSMIRLKAYQRVRQILMVALSLAFLTVILSTLGMASQGTTPLAASLLAVMWFGPSAVLLLMIANRPYLISPLPKPPTKTGRSVALKRLFLSTASVSGFFGLIMLTLFFQAGGFFTFAIFSAISVMPYMGYRWWKNQGLVKKEKQVQETIKAEVNYLMGQIPQVTTTSEEIFSRLVYQVQHSEKRALDFLHINKRNLLNLPQQENSLTNHSFNIVVWGGIQPNVKLKESTVPDSFFMQYIDLQETGAIYAVYYTQLLFITNHQVIAYSFFYDTINDTIATIGTDEYYLKNIVSVSTTTNEWETDYENEALTQQLTFRLAVESGDAVQVSLLETKKQVANDTDGPVDLEDDLSLAAVFAEGVTQAEMAIRFIRRQLKESKRKEPTPAGV